MTEQEKIKKAIRHFECMKNDAVVVLDSGFWTHTGESDLVYRNRKMYAELAIKALEKQMPKKVKIQQWIDTKCECGYRFSKSYEDGYYSVPYENMTNYCTNCGQKLDWGTESE